MSSSYAQSWASALSELGQGLFELPNSNTQDLLSKASHALQQRRGDAEAILARIRQLNPTVAGQFQSKEGTLSELKLRLISSISPQQPQDSSTRTFDSFIVISYCWHYDEWPLAPAAESTAPAWAISRPMVDAAMSLRINADEGIWLDKLCINQNDMQDKMMHIGAMDLIYKSARRTIILLEDIQLTQEETVAGVAYAEFYEDMSSEVMKQELEGSAKSEFVNSYFPERERALGNVSKLQSDGASFALKLLGARWFSRAWCAHESRVTPHAKVNNPLFLCFAHDGSVLSFEFRSIFYISMYLTDHVEPPMPPTGPSLTNAMHDPEPKSLRQRWWRIQHLMPSLGGEDSSSAMYHLLSIHMFGCAQQRDLISIALNTSNIPVAFTGDVAGLDDIIWLFTLLVLAGGDVAPLAMNGSLTTDSENRVSSWAIRPNYGGIDDKLLSPRIESVTGVTKEYIELDLLVFKSMPNAPSPKAMDLASQLVAQHDLLALHQEAADNGTETEQERLQLIKSEVRRIKNNDGPMARFVQTWLAHAIDLGLEWTLRFPDVMKADTEESWMHGTMGVTANPKLTNAATALLNHLIPSDGQVLQGEEERSSIIHTLTRFVTCVLDPKLPTFTINPRSLPCGNGDFAFVPSVSNRSYIAVPAAIAHLPAWMKRAWVIDPFDATASADTQETAQDHLPNINMQLKGDESAEDVFPVLNSDYADRRQPRYVEEGTWRLRRREEIFGCQAFFPDGEAYDNEDGPVMLLKSQRVYGGEDYDWTAIHNAAKAFEAKHGLHHSSKAQDSQTDEIPE